MTNETEQLLHAEALRREAVGFAEFIDRNGYIRQSDKPEPGMWYHIMDLMMEEPFTTNQLYDIYKFRNAGEERKDE